MNGLESIKERFNRWEKSIAFDGEEIYDAVIDNATKDIKYLLQRLERFESALKVIAFPSSIRNDNELIGDYEYLVSIAQEALKE